MTDNTISAEQLQALDRRTEGWVASLQAVALTLQNQSDIDTLSKHLAQATALCSII